MNNKQIGIIIIVFVVALYFIGGFINQDCKEISTCKKCWKTTPVLVQNSTDGLCSSQSCLASADAQRNNAYVDVLLCACNLQRTTETNKQIEDSVRAFSGYQTDANTFCSQPSLIVSKRSYD